MPHPGDQLGSPDAAQRCLSILRWGAILLLAALSLAGAAGLTSQALFTQPTTLKYAVTVAGPLLLLLAALHPRPLEPIVAGMVIVAPFAAYPFTLKGIGVPAILPFGLVAVVLAVATGPHGGPKSSLARSAPFIAALLLLPVLAGTQLSATGDHISSPLVVVGTLLAMSWLVARAAATPEGTRLVIAAVVASAVLQAALAIWEFQTGRTLNLFTSSQSSFASGYFFSYGASNRPTGSYADPISLGNVLAIALPLTTIAALSYRRRGNSLNRGPVAGRTLPVLVMAAGMLIGLGLVLTFSRMSWVAAVAGLALAVLLRPKGARARLAGGLLLLGGLAIVIAVAAAGPTLRTRYDSIFHPTGAGVSTANGDRTRQQLWKAALDVAVQYPVAGVGFDKLAPELATHVADVSILSHAHSTYLQVAAEGGLVLGIGALTLFALALGRDLGKGLRRSPLAAGLAGSILALAICWTTDYTIRYEAVAASVAPLVGLVAAAGRSPRDA
ncbi:MAG TPA: O-antigen ligase family protein [Actinomycetota bacterium]|nr:O-antigen ligase family protein [Actinomycetota bacterium]